MDGTGWAKSGRGGKKTWVASVGLVFVGVHVGNACGHYTRTMISRAVARTAFSF